VNQVSSSCPVSRSFRLRSLPAPVLPAGETNPPAASTLALSWCVRAVVPLRSRPLESLAGRSLSWSTYDGGSVTDHLAGTTVRKPWCRPTVLDGCWAQGSKLSYVTGITIAIMRACSTKPRSESFETSVNGCPTGRSATIPTLAGVSADIGPCRAMYRQRSPNGALGHPHRILCGRMLTLGLVSALPTTKSGCSTHRGSLPGRAARGPPPGIEQSCAAEQADDRPCCPTAPACPSAPENFFQG
jgi:hypothetical protein